MFLRFLITHFEKAARDMESMSRDSPLAYDSTKLSPTPVAKENLLRDGQYCLFFLNDLQTIAEALATLLDTAGGKDQLPPCLYGKHFCSVEGETSLQEVMGSFVLCMPEGFHLWFEGENAATIHAVRGGLHMFLDLSDSICEKVKDVTFRFEVRDDPVVFRRLPLVDGCTVIQKLGSIGMEDFFDIKEARPSQTLTCPREFATKVVTDFYSLLEAPKLPADCDFLGDVCLRVEDKSQWDTKEFLKLMHTVGKLSKRHEIFVRDSIHVEEGLCLQVAVFPFREDNGSNSVTVGCFFHIPTVAEEDRSENVGDKQKKQKMVHA